MSFEKWIGIKNNAKANAESAIKALTLVNETEGTALQLAEEFNSLLADDFQKIGEFLDENKLWNQAKVGKIENIWLQYKREAVLRGLGSGNPGIVAKCSAIHLCVAKLDQIFSGEKRIIDKANFAISLLNRKLFLLPRVKEEWLEIFNTKTEPALESLGALHLFECGICAFKAAGPKEETDLILNQEIEKIDEGLPLVMTEWKKANDEAEAAIKIETAVKQCEIYIGGVARPLQVQGHRMIIIVSKKVLKIEKEFDEIGKRYLVRNVAIERDRPSKEAERK